MSVATATTPSTQARRAPSRSKSLESPVRGKLVRRVRREAAPEKDLHPQAPRRAADPTYSFTAWDLATRAGAGLLWRAPTGLGLPIVKVLSDGTYLSVLINPAIRGAQRRKAIMAVAREIADGANAGGEVAELDPTQAHLVRVVEYDVPDREGNGTGELIVLLSNILDPAQARADELAAAYHQRWEEETGNDQLKTHLRGPGKILRSKLPELVHQEIWAWLLVHHALITLVTRAAEAAALDPDRVSFTRVLRITRRTATGTAGFSP